MGCPDVTITKVKYEKRPNSEELKQSIYDPSMITDDVLTDLFGSKETNKTQYDTLFNNDDALLPYKSVADKTSVLQFFDKEQKPFGEIVGEVTTGKEARYLTIALTHLLSVQKSEADTAENLRLTDDQLLSVTDEKTGVIQTAYSNMARTIGRDILKTHGYRIVPKNENGLAASIAYETEVGMEALNMLDARNLITVGKGNVLNRGFMKLNPTSKEDTRYTEDNGKVVSDVKTIILRPITNAQLAAEGTVLTDKKTKADFQSMSKLAATRALINPSNMSNPFTEAQEINPQAQDMTITDKDRKTLEQVQESELQLTPFMKEALGDVKDIIDKSRKGSTKSVLAGLTSWITDSKASAMLFGTTDHDALNEALMDDVTGFEQAYGRANAKILQFNRILDNWDNVQEGLFYTFQIATQNRAHTLQQTLDYQGDNFLSRHVLGTSVEQELSTKEDIDYIAGYIMDETGLSKEELFVGKKGSKLDEYISYLENKESNKDSALGILMTIAKDIDEGDLAFTKPPKSAWEVMSYVQAIKDIRDGINGDGTVRTRFMPKPDATASGAYNTAAQASRDGGEVASVVDKLLDPDTDFNDMYKLALDELQSDSKDLKEYKGGDALRGKRKKVMAIIDSITNEKGGIIASQRDLIKLPFTKFIYGQSLKNNAIEISKEMASLLIEDNNTKLMTTILGKDLPASINERRKLLIAKLSEERGVAETLVKIVDKEVGSLFERQTTELGDMHDLMTEAVYDSGSLYEVVKILPPSAALQSDKDLSNNNDYATERSQFGTTIDKYFETVVSDKDGDLTTIKKRYPNKNSIKVLLQHMMDAALLFGSLQEVLAQPEFKNYKEGMMLNHDSIAGTVQFARALEVPYQRLSTELNADYDFIEAALWELKYARSNVFKDAAEVNAEKASIDSEVRGILAGVKELEKEGSSAKNKIAIEMDKAEKLLARKKKIKENGKLAEKMDNYIAKIEKDLPARIETKRKTLLKEDGTGRVGESLFGVKPRILKELKETDHSSYKVDKPKPKTETKTETKPDFVEDPDNPTPFATSVGFNFKDLTDKVKKAADTIIESAKVAGEELNKSTEEKNRKHFAELLNFTPEEQATLEKRLGKDRYDRIINAMYENAGDINTLPNFDAFQFGAMFDPATGRVIMPSMLNIDPRLATFTKAQIAEMESKPIASLLFLKNKVKEVNKLDSFEKKAVYMEILGHELDHKVNYNSIVDFTNPFRFDTKRVNGELVKDFSFKDKSPELQYIEKTMLDLRKKLDKVLREDNLSPEMERMRYALYGTDFDSRNPETIDAVSMLEFTAIMRNEPKYAELLYREAYPEKSDTWITNAVRKLLQQIQKMVDMISGNRSELTAKNVQKLSRVFKGVKDAPSRETLKAALDIAHYKAMLSETKGKPTTEQKLGFINVISDDYKPFKPPKKEDRSKDTIVSDKVEQADRALAKAIQNTIDLTIDTTVGSDVAKETHEKLMKSSSIYRDTFNGINNVWENDTFIAKVKFYLDLDENAKRKEFNILNTQVIHAEERKAQFETDKVNSLYKASKGMFTEAENETLYELLDDVPIANLNADGTLLNLIKGKETIDEAITRLLSTSELNPKTKAASKAKAKELAEYYIDKKAPVGFPTNRHLPPLSRKLVGELSALYSMKKIKNVNSILQKMGQKEQRAYVNKLLELTSAVKALDDELYGTIALEADTHNGNLSTKIFENNIQVRQITANNVNKVLNEDLGWKILRHPTSNVAGIMYRDAGDITFQSGLATSLKLEPNLTITLGKDFNPAHNNATSRTVGGGATIVFTNKELETMGLKKDPITSLVKGYSHRMMLLETQAVREELVNEFTYNYEKDQSKILKDIKEGKHNWYIKLPKGTTLDQLPKEIRQKYKAARASSDVDGFKDKVTLVRKDMSDFVEGYQEIQIGGVNTKLNKAFSILKKSILLQKIHWVIVAPVKIAMDATSNVAYLLSRNVPILTIARKTKRITNDLVTFTKLREDLLHAEFRNRVSPSKAGQKRIDKLEKQIKEHRLASAYFRGFISSIAIDLTQKNEHTAAGLHKDIGTVLDKLFKDDKKSLNTAGKAIMTMAKFGVNGEDILLRVAGRVGNKEEVNVSGKVAKTLTEIAEHIKELKSEDDVSNYLQEYMATPGSALVNVGSVLVQTPDIIAKVILQEHLVEQEVVKFRKKNNGRNPSPKELMEINEEASIESVKSFIDYKVNIPRELRFLEQTGVTSFITFWARIQKVMLRSLRDNPMNAMLTIAMSELLSLDGATIFDANALDKFGSGSLVGGPNPGLDILFPIKLFG